MVGKPKTLSDAEAQKANLAAFKAWCGKNRKLIKAKSGKAVVYSGGEYDIKIAFDDKTQKDVVTNTKMWEVLQKINTGKLKGKLPTDYETLEDVLKRIRDHPVLIDRDSNEKDFAHVYEYLEWLKKLSRLFPAPEIDKAWRALSTIYCENAEGDVAFFDGVSEDYGLLENSRILIHDELIALLKNPKLSDKTKKELGTKIGKYGKYLEIEQKRVMKTILNERKTLTER